MGFDVVRPAAGATDGESAGLSTPRVVERRPLRSALADKPHSGTRRSVDFSPRERPSVSHL